MNRARTTVSAVLERLLAAGVAARPSELLPDDVIRCGDCAPAGAWVLNFAGVAVEKFAVCISVCVLLAKVPLDI